MLRKYQIRVIDNGIEKIEKYLNMLPLEELELLYEVYKTKFRYFKRFENVGGGMVYPHLIGMDEDPVILWDREKIIHHILHCNQTFTEGGLFDFMTQYTKGELQFDKF
jgi:hypothetical protein